MSHPVDKENLRYSLKLAMDLYRNYHDCDHYKNLFCDLKIIHKGLLKYYQALDMHSGVNIQAEIEALF